MIKPKLVDNRLLKPKVIVVEDNNRYIPSLVDRIRDIIPTIDIKINMNIVINTILLIILVLSGYYIYIIYDERSNEKITPLDNIQQDIYYPKINTKEDKIIESIIIPENMTNIDNTYSNFN